MDYPNYECNHTEWELLFVRNREPNFKLLYDIYHMQIMDGDIISLSETSYYIAITTAGTYRNEIDESQELNYYANMK